MTAPEARTSFRKTREGLVVSDKMEKTVVVAVEDRVKHALYGKVIRRTNKLKAHDETNQVGVGDRVLIMETRPLSASKRWRVVEVLEGKVSELKAAATAGLRSSAGARNERRAADEGSRRLRRPKRTNKVEQ